MTNDVGAPGTKLSRRRFVKATGTLGLAGCAAPTNTERAAETAAQGSAPSLPQAAKPQVVDVPKQNNQVLWVPLAAKAVGVLLDSV